MVEDLADEVGIGDICDFKTHLEYTRVNKGARYIHVVREPKDVLVAFYGFFFGTVFDPKAIPLDVFADFWLLATRQATFEFMFEHRNQFADTIPGTPMRFDKVVNGKVGSHATRVSTALADRIDAAWDRYVTPALVITSYGELRSLL